MSEHDDESASIEAFAGQVRLFPLPNLVLFPHVVQPLHVFEPPLRRSPRRRDRRRPADRNGRLAAWVGNRLRRPAADRAHCLLGSRPHLAGVPENRYNLLLLGLRRVRLIGEMPSERSFREARAEIVEDAYPSAAAAGAIGCDAG